MKRWCVSVALLCLLACRDPNSYQPTNPTKPDPPAPPVLTSPADGWAGDSVVYPQDVNHVWQRVPGAQFYEIQVCRWDSLFTPAHLTYSNARVYETWITVSETTYGGYYWRVRAASSNWNNYTNWSDAFHFMLPNPRPPK